MGTMKKHAPVWTVAVGGAAGDGIKEGGIHLAELAQHLGCFVYLSNEYPSLIRGGHNLARLSYSEDAVTSDRAPLDAIIATNSESVLLHTEEYKPDAVAFVDAPHAEHLKEVKVKVVALPMSAAVKELNAPHAAGPSVGVGAFCFLAGLSREETDAYTRKAFGDILGGIEMNVALALKGYDAAKASGLVSRTELRSSGACVHEGVLLEGNKSFGLGLLSAGLEFYIAYPMTPASSILHFLAKEAVKGRLKVIHPEDELTVINMALGVSYAGKRVAIGSASGGFALMQEAFSFAGVSEIPITVAVSQRQGPATGAATRTAQADLRFVLSAGHGEFPRIVIAPGDPEEAFTAGQTALNLAWKYQLPTIVLLDKALSENFQTSTIADGVSNIVPHKAFTGGEYSRFKFSADGVSELTFPGTPGANVKATSYEHDEFGIAADKPEMVKAMQDKRWKKMDGVREEMRTQETVKIYGDKTAKNALIFWGSTKGAILETAKEIEEPLRLVQVLWMEPFDAEGIMRALDGATNIINVEANRNAQFAGLLREKTGVVANDMILKYDARPFEPVALAEEIKKRLK